MVELVGQSPVFLAATRSLARMARFDVPILIEGETGTGKELAARAVHYQSARRNRPFIPLNCGALPEALVENELFGHERGAYTDARESTPGVVALAEGGTLFLDEIDALSTKAQIAFLRFLQDQRYRPLGGLADRRADLRIIAATNQNLEELVEQGQYRSDLLFRIKVLFVSLPPLRLRVGDARLLAEHFLDQCARRFHEPRKRLGLEMLAWLDDYPWPGNVRELENLILRESLMTEGSVLVYPHAPHVAPACRSPASFSSSYARAKAAAVAEFDRRFLRELLIRASGNVTRAAADAGKDRRALGRLVKKYGLCPRDFRR
jgi:transcriptional regulator with PAS, ATPase and Fis domain